jgi:hypothetical protein
MKVNQRLLVVATKGQQSTALSHSLPAVCAEANRIRRENGERPIGALAVARKLFGHFHEEANDRAAEVLNSLAAKAESSA